MPAKSRKQQRFMALCAKSTNRGEARGKCPPKAVAKKYSRKPRGGYK